MPSVLGLLKAEYVFQPRRLARRLLGVGARAPQGPGPYALPLPWGVSLEMRAFDGRAREIDRFGVHDLVVTEALWRLVRPGDTVIDAGANVGYMTSAMVAGLRTAGRVVAFEPHPAIFDELSVNAERARARFPGVSVECKRLALSDSEGTAWLSMGADWERTRGTASLQVRSEGAGEGFQVTTRRLDDLAGELGEVAVMKVDVEGHEPALFRGAQAMLSRGQIRHIVFEEHGRYPTEATALLERSGYTISSLERTLLRVRTGDPAHPRQTSWQAPSFVASRDPQAVSRALKGFGWRALA